MKVQLYCVVWSDKATLSPVLWPIHVLAPNIDRAIVAARAWLKNDLELCAEREPDFSIDSIRHVANVDCMDVAPGEDLFK